MCMLLTIYPTTWYIANAPQKSPTGLATNVIAYLPAKSHNKNNNNVNGPNVICVIQLWAKAPIKMKPVKIHQTNN